MKNGPELWRALLALARPVFGAEAVVAGGCIRDFFLGVEPKDYDIFVLCDSGEALAQVGVNLKLHPVIFEGNPEEHEYEAWSNGKLVGCLEGDLLGVPVNIVARTDLGLGVWRLIEGFDMGIVQAFFDGVCVYNTQAFTNDLEQRTATFMTHEGNFVSRQRFERFDKRHPGLLTKVDPFSTDTEDEF